MSFRDHFSSAAAAYATFRPRYPEALFAFLAREAPGTAAAWDAGTGSGQAAVGLAQHFDDVLATDASETQIAHATPHPRVTYRIAQAEDSGLPSRSVDLVTAAQAVHWFDRSQFWAEVRRVLKPRGVIAVWTYDLLEIAPAIDAIIRRFYRETVGPFWPAERRLIEERYRTIDFPFAEFSVPDFKIEPAMTLGDVAGYLRTWSATRGYVKQYASDPVDELVAELTPVWGDPQTLRRATWPVAMRAGRI